MLVETSSKHPLLLIGMVGSISYFHLASERHDSEFTAKMGQIERGALFLDQGGVRFRSSGFFHRLYQVQEKQIARVVE